MFISETDADKLQLTWGEESLLSRLGKTGFAPGEVYKTQLCQQSDDCSEERLNALYSVHVNV